MNLHAAPKTAAGDPSGKRDLIQSLFIRLHKSEGDTCERNRIRSLLIEANLSLVKNVIRTLRRSSHRDWEDIYQVGVVGLIKAVDRFDCTRGVTFSAFAIPYIRGEIIRYFRDSCWAVHVPRGVKEKCLALARARESLFEELGREPTLKECAAYMKIKEETVRQISLAAAGYASGAYPEDSDPGAHDPMLEQSETWNSIERALTVLDERELVIFRLRFGAEMTQAEIGAIIGIS
ncbi:sigma-70 family RNA polymerase sigma factor, partial [Streptomyces sp. NPDC096198]|uniref:sigma-70 family RNA polymerase sigma factor n=1 Tax=Streptomyces sp. NPDC096198 TaxID=3366080 RepID=UPI00381DE9C2